MSKKKNNKAAPRIAAPVVAVAAVTLESRVSEIESDLIRIADLLSSGNMDGAKFREIVTKRQETAK